VRRPLDAPGCVREAVVVWFRAITDGHRDTQAMRAARLAARREAGHTEDVDAFAEVLARGEMEEVLTLGALQTFKVARHLGASTPDAMRAALSWDQRTCVEYRRATDARHAERGRVLFYRPPHVPRKLDP